MADLRRARLRLGGRTRRVVVIGVVVVVVGGGGAVAWAMTRPAGAAYRTATAGPASVTESLPGTGTIQPVSQATVTFPMTGLVSSVAAQVGQHVAVGQTLAQLNTTSLDNAVSADQSAVASAQAKLASDQDSQTSVTTSDGQSTSPSSFSESTPSPLTGLVHSLSGDQDAVRKAQRKVDEDLTLVAAADHKVNAAGAACQDLLDQLKTPPPTTTTPPTTSPTTTTAPPTDSTSVSDCEALINEALADETTAGSDEHALSTAVATLSTALNKVVAEVGKSAAQSSSPSHTGSGRSGDSQSQSQSRSGQSERVSVPVSADQIAADQASVDAANAQLAAAKQNLSAATLVSPIAGTVAQVTITQGQNASANSADAQVVVIGGGEDEVTTAVTDSQVGQVKPGETATVTPDGATAPITGTVTQIGALGTTTTSGSASYPVTISLGDTTQQLFDGATASVSITLGTTHAAVAVPTSAVRTVGAFSVVTKMVDGKPTITRVTTGVRGPTMTEVTNGLQAGDQVALANIDEPMPTSGNTPGAGRLGGFARGGLGGGGGGFSSAPARAGGGGGGR